jgi:hypothetical protein
MNPFQKLPGSRRVAPGIERALWRRLPAILLWGTLLPLLLAGARRWWASMSPTPPAEASLLLGDYLAFGVVVLHWTLVLTVGLGCVIVMVMKGPAYVADAYPLEDADEGPAPR